MNFGEKGNGLSFYLVGKGKGKSELHNILVSMSAMSMCLFVYCSALPTKS